MRIVVFGANGRVGQRVTAQLVERGHQVRAFVYSGSEHLPQRDNLEIMTGDATVESDVAKALHDMDAAVCTLSSWKASTEVLSTWATHVVSSAASTPELRVVSVTGSAVLRLGDHTAWYDHLNRALLRLIAPRVFRDGAHHIEILAASPLDWYVLRSPVMRVKPSRTYQLSARPALPWQTMPYDAVACALCDLVESAKQDARSPFIVP